MTKPAGSSSGYGAPHHNDRPRFPGRAPNPTYLVTEIFGFFVP